jgi:hypothetical protein
MRIEPFPLTHTILEKLGVEQGENIITIVRNDPEIYKNRFGIQDKYYVNGFLSELYCYSEIDSLAETPIPNYESTDSDTAKLNKTLAVVWAGPRFHLCTWIAKTLNPSADSWVKTGMISLLNSAGYPYRRDRPLDLLTDNLAREFGENTCIGVSLKGVGYGLPDVRDLINIDGAWKQDCRIVQPDFIPVLVSGGTVQPVTQRERIKDLTISSINANRKVSVLAINNTRLSAAIANTSQSSTFYYAERDITPTSTDNDGTILAGATRTVRAGYMGSVNIASTGAGSLTSTELYN